jgi:D-alanyl-lipoteichoic acid acyltransferase DltB (MBOAT superfamily)
MLFNSIDFAIFLPIVFILYWFVFSKNLKAQNLLILVSSYIFYGWWDWRFLSLIMFSSLVDYFVGVRMLKATQIRKRKLLLLLSILVNLGFLGFFKYYNFFLDNFIDAFEFFGNPINSQGLNIVLPVGISFYTFQTMSYSIDVFKGKLKPTKNIVAFFAFVSFFPQLVAGPIERASNLLPQFYKKRSFIHAQAVDGMRQILWGLFKKVVIADNAANFANLIFNNYEDYSGSTLLLGAVFFAFQIYGDFSGYSDIAIGTSRLFGFNLKQNFAFPYFSRDIAEFWRRWHISLSTWFRDYVYIPLGGSKGGTWMKTRNIFIIFLVSGFWHGANWTFIVWGALNAIYFLPLMLLNKNRINTNLVAENRLLPNLKEFFQMSLTFFITTIAWVFFRSETISKSFEIINVIFSKSIFSLPEEIPSKFLVIVIVFIVIEWLQRDKHHALQLDNGKMPRIIRFSIYYLIIFIIIWKGGNHQEFIYFQF